MTEFRMYLVTVLSDQGRYTLQVSAQNEFSAKQLVMACQGCPGHAILEVHVIKSKWEEINQKKPVYLAYDCEQLPRLISANLQDVVRYCKVHNCNYSTYPVGTYSEIN
jgi:hypothetical protein